VNWGRRAAFWLAPFILAVDTPRGTTFQAKPGRWIGAQVGLFALVLEPGAPGGHADIEYFRFSP